MIKGRQLMLDFTTQQHRQEFKIHQVWWEACLLYQRLTHMQLTSFEGLRFRVHRGMTQFSFLSLLRLTSRTGSGTKVTRYCVIKGGNAMYLAFKAVRCFTDVWHCRKVLIISLRCAMIKVTVPTLVTKWSNCIWCSICSFFFVPWKEKTHFHKHIWHCYSLLEKTIRRWVGGNSNAMEQASLYFPV